jgi:hypothetical protein
MKKNQSLCLLTLGLLLWAAWLQAQVMQAVQQAKPLERLYLHKLRGKTVYITDGQGREYFRSPVQAVVSFVAGGALGEHQVWVIDDQGKKALWLRFQLQAQTQISDGGGHYTQMFELFHRSMEPSPLDGNAVTWNGQAYRYFVPWILDHCHNMRGQKYFHGYGAEFVDLLAKSQRADGMIYSFVQYMPNADYFKTRDKFSGYTQQLGDRAFVRQPTENHPEYNYVNTIYQCWKSAGDDAWMQGKLTSAAQALDYALNDPARWSTRFQLLKRVYTIDSWDFAVDDEYLPNLGLTNSMIIDPKLSKFGVFFGDNTGYISACQELAEMYAHSGQKAAAQRYRQRAQDIQARLDQLAWNGRFYTHFIDEDSTVVRKLGVDERSQIAQSNAYSLNRGLPVDKNKAIIQTYLQLKAQLPVGSPGEWYAIYPPFGRGFEQHGATWQYMNGGVGGHVAGELARGAFENGYEHYASDILDRLFALGKKYDNKIYFSYTGSIPPAPPPPVYRPLELQSLANMDFWVHKNPTDFSWMLGKRVGDDLRNLPTGLQTFANIPFKVIDPTQNQSRGVLAVSKQAGLPQTLDIPINDTAACVYFLHTSSKPNSEQVVGAVTFTYSDGSSQLQYLLMDKHLTYWWFSQLQTEHSGIAWYGKNEVSEGVGLSWCALDNPYPQKKIAKLTLHAAEGKVIYTLFGLTLANRKHDVPVKGPSFGGPDNWAGATAMAALVEGMAGVNNAPQSQAFRRVRLAPRWAAGTSDSVNVTVCSPAANAYVAYRFVHQRANRRIELHTTGSGEGIQCHLLLPEGVSAVKMVRNRQGLALPFQAKVVGQSRYLDFELERTKPEEVVIVY